MDTIFALATAQGRAGVAVIRISGPSAFDVTHQLVGDIPPPRLASLRKVRDADGTVMDEALVLAFSGPASFTGEDVVELHLHGSPAINRAVLHRLSALDARLAEPGEFTRRALENDKMDLLQVEALGDLISAETEAQRRQAMRGYDGAFTARIDGWRMDLIRAAALIEATIDFADEDVPVDVSPEVSQLLQGVQQGIQADLSGFAAAERVRIGFEVAIVGPPNAGKSTLLNALARRDAAITSQHAGTTRDVIEVQMDLGGVAVTLLDTAGLRDTDDEVEAEGVARAMSRAQAADIRVFLAEQSEPLPLSPLPDDIVLAPKADLRTDGAPSISGTTGEGVQNLVERLSATLSDRASGAGLATQERHRVALQSAIEDLSAAMEKVEKGPDLYDIAAEDIRTATRVLAILIGRVDVEHLLDEVFSSFCLGK
ncbi:tRNA uridine-5-carboxymethylaminomethyl(34) synthesis GTPase MnmE [uncultured Tateyamaria sp.]|uniref:tRNA uridine-5-carboxymethylaminomethyl(34) synthesis GTPase MnmE n=1 Tax=Tateyamaria sp. 1078 TaxID=3417464 RepID=UPI002607371F|nr:tRNA uridine-5-carboxymethylaminomethyl(34) synthesis GTPase MnmE [uncultured Tateyamaria sp.]